MSDDLVKQLREPAFGTETTERKLMKKAADRIEQLAKHALRADATCEQLEDKLAECEARLEKAVGSLTVIDALDPEGFVNGCSQSALIGLVSRMGAIARTTIEEIKGSNT